MTNYGDLAWATRTGGRLRGLELLRQRLVAVKAQLALRLRGRPDLTGALDAARALREVELPSSPAVKAVLSTIETLGPPALVGHALRTYAFGTVLGIQAGLAWDRELFAFGALLHDIALARRRSEYTCFAHDGALQAIDLLEAHGVEPARAQQAGEGICLHLRVSVPPELGVEAHLVNAGSGLDVVGMRVRELSPETVDAIVARHPRGDLVRTLQQVLAEEARLHPESRIARWHEIGFSRAIARNPLGRGD